MAFCLATSMSQTIIMSNISSKSVVFIAGAFVGNNCWDEWKIYFESKGYKCIAPPWPHKDADPEELRNRHPDAAIASNRLTTLTDHFAGIVEALPEKPILIGHSVGGLIVQLLLQLDLGAAGIAIHSFPPKGVVKFHFTFLKTVWGACDFFTSAKKTYLISFRKWKHAITNGMTCDQQKQSYYKYAIPESRLVVKDTMTIGAKINFEKPHAPLLLTSGANDKLIPPSINYNNYKRYKKDISITHYKEFKGRNHFVLGQPTWIEDADFILYWLQGIKSNI